MDEIDMKLGIYEILKKAASKKNRNEKIQVLRENYTKQLHMILNSVFSENIEFLLPETIPPYKPAPNSGTETMLYTEARKMDIFIKGFPRAENLPQVKRETLFINMLETVHPEDAEILTYMIKKKLPPKYKGITKKLYEEAFSQ
jgi:hypothetical protein